MTNEEAINYLESIPKYIDYNNETYDAISQEMLEAIQWAIETLNTQRRGEWRPIILTSYPPKYREMCSCCGFMKNKEAFRFCPICGASMEWKGEEDGLNQQTKP